MDGDDLLSHFTQLCKTEVSRLTVKLLLRSVGLVNGTKEGNCFPFFIVSVTVNMPACSKLLMTSQHSKKKKVR